MNEAAMAFKRKWKIEGTLENIIKVLVEQSKLPYEKITEKIRCKKQDLNGFGVRLTDEAAACIVAKEIGVELFSDEKMGARKMFRCRCTVCGNGHHEPIPFCELLVRFSTSHGDAIELPEYCPFNGDKECEWDIVALEDKEEVKSKEGRGIATIKSEWQKSLKR